MPVADRVPFTLLGGYLGAGKTTILNQLIRHAGGRRLVVLVNDIGAVNVDASLVARHEGTTLTLTNGCVCCSIADEVGPTLERIRALDPRPDHVVMELSGVAEPARVAPWASTGGFRLDGVAVVADADRISEQVGRELVGDTIRAQLAAADLVLVSKTDLVADGGTRALATIAGLTSAPCVVTEHGEVGTAVLLGIDRPANAPVPGGPGVPGESGGYLTWTIDVGEPTLAELRAFVEQIPGDVLRAKGLVACVDEPDPVEVHVVGGRRTVRRRRDLPVERCDPRLVAIGVAPI